MKDKDIVIGMGAFIAGNNKVYMPLALKKKGNSSGAGIIFVPNEISFSEQIQKSSKV